MTGIQQLRGLAWLALSDVAHIGAGSITDDTGGGGTFSWTFGAAVPCRIDPLAGDERLTGGRMNARSTHVVTMPPGVDVLATNQISIENRGTFEVTAVQSRTGEMLRFVEVVEVT